MKVKLNTGICSIINVAMYESIISPSHIFEDGENKVAFSDALTKDEKEYFENEYCSSWNSDAYKKLVADYAMEIIESFLKSINDTVIISLCGTGAIDSPSYHNYRSDELDFEVEIEQEELMKILSNVTADAVFFKWAEQFKSHSGFISWMPYRRDDYIQAINGEDIERSLAMYLSYLYEKQNNFKENEFDHTYELYEKISSNHGITEFIEDIKAVEIYIKASEGAV
jgi:hypothetical protein